MYTVVIILWLASLVTLVLVRLWPIPPGPFFFLLFASLPGAYWTDPNPQSLACLLGLRTGIDRLATSLGLRGSRPR
jgi:hypothetical protein